MLHGTYWYMVNGHQSHAGIHTKNGLMNYREAKNLMKYIQKSHHPI